MINTDINDPKCDPTELFKLFNDYTKIRGVECFIVPFISEWIYWEYYKIDYRNQTYPSKYLNKAINLMRIWEEAGYIRTFTENEKIISDKELSELSMSDTDWVVFTISDEKENNV